MTIRFLKKIVLDFRHQKSICLTYSRSIHYVSSASSQSIYNPQFYNRALIGYFTGERKFSNKPRISPYPRIGSFLCNNDTVLCRRIISNPYCLAVNNIRYYSNPPPIAVNEAIAYNTGYFQMISESLPVKWATDILRLMHYDVGLPWWATLIITTVAARILINLPFTILDFQTRARQKNLEAEMIQVAKRIKMEMQMGMHTSELTSAQAAFLSKRAFDRERKEMYERENCHPFKSFIILLLQAPIWISFSVAVRNMCFMLPERNAATMQDYFGLANGGIGWIQDLTQLDPFFVLPIAFGLSGLAIIEINDVLFNMRETKARKIFRNISRAIIVCFIPITALIPSCLSLYWVTNNCCGLVQSLVFLSPRVRRLVRIPKTNVEYEHPYAELSKRLLDKFQLKRSVAKA